ncbi:hypothetical protein HZU77_008400 [Neisseriaceae bacterium TC5R-5]|nr:hypothetical protein [Neisseriaceae bacterium TC5R-5]
MLNKIVLATLAAVLLSSAVMASDNGANNAREMRERMEARTGK